MIAPQPLARWRETYQAERQTAFAAYQAKPQVSRLLSALTHAVDGLLNAIWTRLELPAGAALVAVGGYARREMFPHSDVDLLILLDDALTDSELSRFEPLIGLFWDVGLPVGHSVRRVSECLAEAAGDITIQTNLLEARHLCGDTRLTEQLQTDLRAALDPVAFLNGKRIEQNDRHGRFADRGLMLEPNLKDSPGGLRDLHMIDWVAQAAGFPRLGNDCLRALEDAGLFCRLERNQLRAQRRFLAHLRIRLHLAAGRREERLLFEFQERIAAEMGFSRKGARRASEVLMQRFFRTARAVSLANQILLGSLQHRVEGPRASRANLLDITDARTFERDNTAIFNAFLELEAHPEKIGFTPRALRLLARAGRRMNSAFRRDPRHQAQFLAILSQPRGVTLAVRQMHRLGLIGRYLPPFARITGQMQHDLYHIHPVDEHSLMLLRNLRRLSLNEFAHEFPLGHRLMQAFYEPHLLYLAALFHDIAKGRGGDHSELGEVEMRRFCRSHHLSEAHTELLCWLVRQHLSMSTVAQKHDLSDPAVIETFARHCGDLRHLDALYLLTLSDIRATNPAIWNAWKDSLLKTLYHATHKLLEGREPVIDSVEDRREQARATLRLYGWSDGAETKLWGRLDDVWFLRSSAAEIAWQTRALLPALRRGKNSIVKARLSPIGEGADILVYTPDRHGLFADICGFFTTLGYSVLDARIHTTRDGYALDSFLVMAANGSKTTYRDMLNYIEFELAQALELRLAPEVIAGRMTRQQRAFPLAPQLTLTRSEGRNDYVLNLSAGDRAGLLYDIARVLADHAVSVTTARVHTLGGRAEDVFVLEGKLLDDKDQRLQLEHVLLDKLRIR